MSSSTRFPKGFKGNAIAAGIKSSGLDMALIVNHGRSQFASGVFTSNQIQAAPVTWTQSAIRSARLDAVLLNSGGANACTGVTGERDVSESAFLTAKLLGNETYQ
ncbi:MAG: bifunctional ornithine acetyltransferase/N-acetylglutamate synthase, partial [Actinomycetales bacterium]